MERNHTSQHEEDVTAWDVPDCSNFWYLHDHPERPLDCGPWRAHLNHAEERGEESPRVPLLMTICDKLANALREES
jgi:hypothetical protein